MVTQHPAIRTTTGDSDGHSTARATLALATTTSALLCALLCAIHLVDNLPLCTLCLCDKPNKPFCPQPSSNKPQQFIYGCVYVWAVGGPGPCAFGGVGREGGREREKGKRASTSRAAKRVLCGPKLSFCCPTKCAGWEDQRNCANCGCGALLGRKACSYFIIQVS